MIEYISKDKSLNLPDSSIRKLFQKTKELDRMIK